MLDRIESIRYFPISRFEVSSIIDDKLSEERNIVSD